MAAHVPVDAFPRRAPGHAPPPLDVQEEDARLDQEFETFRAAFTIAEKRAAVAAMHVIAGGRK